VDAHISAGPGVAIREFPLPGHGFADYLLYVDGKAGVVGKVAEALAVHRSR
jgi:type I restriction enzyme R subunit